MPTRTAHDVTHFRHCGRLKSMATDQGDMFLTTGISGRYPSGSLSVTPLTSNGTDDDGFNQCFWLYSDWGATASGIAWNLGEVTWDGDTYIGATIPGNPFNSSFSYQNLYYDLPVTSGGTLYVRTDTNGFRNIHGGSTCEEFDVVAAASGGFIIYARGTDLCITAGSSASDTLGSQNVTPYLVTYAAKKNQHWALAEINELAGVFQLAPALQPAFAILSPGQSTADNSLLGLGAYDTRDMSSTWSIFFRSSKSYDDDIWRCESYPNVSLTGLTDDASYWAAPSDPTPPCSLYQRHNLFISDMLYARYSRSMYASDLSLNTPQGQYTTKQYTIGNTSNAISSQLGDQKLDSLVWGQAASSYMTSDWYPQYWYRIPRNIFKSSLPQPYDVRIWMYDHDTSSGRYISSLDQIDPTHHIELHPRFICPSGAYVVSLRLAHEDADDWEVILSPENSAVWDGLAKAPFATPNVGTAWAPNAFAASRGEDDYVHLDAGFDFPDGLWDYSVWGTVNDTHGPLRLSVTVSSFSYDNGAQGQDDRMPWRPYQGLSSTAEFRIADQYLPWISAIHIDDTSLVMTWAGNDYASVRQDSDVMRMRHLIVQWTDGDGTHNEDLLLDTYDCPIQNPQGGVRQLRVPLGVLDADVAIAIVASIASGGTVTLTSKSDIRLVTQYGLAPIPIVSWGINVTMEAGAVSYTTSATATRYWTTFPEPSASQPLTHAYARTMTERGPRLVEMPTPATSSSSRMAIWADGGYLNAHEGPRHALVFARLSSSPNTLYYATSIDSLVITNPVSSLGWRTSDGRLHLILLDGNLRFSYGRQRDISSAIRRGGTRYMAASSGTEVPSLKFSGTIYRGQRGTASTSDVVIHDSIDDIYRIPDDEPVTFRTSYGTTYPVIITAIDSPRNVSGLAQVSISMLELEDS